MSTQYLLKDAETWELNMMLREMLGERGALRERKPFWTDGDRSLEKALTRDIQSVRNELTARAAAAQTRLPGF